MLNNRESGAQFSILNQSVFCFEIRKSMQKSEIFQTNLIEQEFLLFKI